MGGERNMALDRALLRAYQRGELNSPLLRVYAWDPPALSLGYHQSVRDLDLSRLRAQRIDLVRRPSGGGAVLHWREWTYAVAGPLGIPGLGGGFREIYASLAGSLVEALNRLGVAAQSEGTGGPESFLCFESLHGHEISVGGRKLVGSAFRQTRRAFLQHGSLLVGPEHLRIVELLGEGNTEEREARRQSLRRRTTNLKELGHSELSAESFALAFADTLSARLKLAVEVLESYPNAVSVLAEDSSLLSPAARILP